MRQSFFGAIVFAILRFLVGSFVADKSLSSHTLVVGVVCAALFASVGAIIGASGDITTAIQRRDNDVGE